MTQLRQNIYRELDEVLETGIPIEVERHGRLLQIVAVPKIRPPMQDKLSRLVKHDDFIVGNSDDLADIHWDHEVNLDLP